MELTLFSVLALFGFLLFSTLVYFLAEKIKAPYSVLLVASGLLLVPLSKVPGFSFMREFTLTPELLFYIFLPALLFEAAFNMNARKVTQNIGSIAGLAIIGLLISTFIAGVALKFGLSLIGIEVPIILTFLFGAIISSTDPVAVLALFKEYGAPHRLSLIFEGESVANDGTAVAIFFILLAVIQDGFKGFDTIVEGILMFSEMIIGGILLGLLFGWIFSRLVYLARSIETVAVSMMLALAHLTFIISEVISQKLTVGGQHIHISAIIATAVAALVMGNYGRYKLSPRIVEKVDGFWTQIGFLANSIVFLLLGLLFITIEVPIFVFLIPIVIAIIVEVIARAISVYPVVGLLNLTKREEHIPLSWQHVMAWGSLRGALAITMVLLVPDSLTFANWNLPYSPKEFLMALTIGCILFTLFVKATTIGSLIKKLKLDKLSIREELSSAQAQLLILANDLKKIEYYRSKGYMEEHRLQEITSHHNNRMQTLLRSLDSQEDKAEYKKFFELYALGIERHALKELYMYDEINDSVHRRILAKLRQQQAHIEENMKYVESSSELPLSTRFMFEWEERYTHNTQKTRNKFLYYRAQLIIARKVVKELDHLLEHSSSTLIDVEIVKEIREKYLSFKNGSESKMNTVRKEHEEIIEALLQSLSTLGISKNESRLIEHYEETGLIPHRVAHEVMKGIRI